MGKPEVLAENLDRWGADEIILQCIDRSRNNAGPDFEALSKIANKGLGTPITYAGGVRTAEDAIRVVQSGADRIALDALLHDSPSTVIELSHKLGAQALVASLPVSHVNNELRWYDYRSQQHKPFSAELLQLLKDKVISEVMLIDWQHEGQENGFQLDLIHNFPACNTPIIAFGGLSSTKIIGEALSLTSVSATAIGNFLSYKEHAIASYKQQLCEFPIRMPYSDGVL